jgi:hypothetical protein
VGDSQENLLKILVYEILKVSKAGQQRFISIRSRLLSGHTASIDPKVKVRVKLVTENSQC